RRIRHRIEHAVGLYSIGSVGVQRLIALIGRSGPSDAAADEDPAAFAPLHREVEPRIGDGLSGGDQRQLADAIEHPQPRCWKVCAAIETDRGSDRGAKPLGLGSGETLYTGSAGDEIGK